MRKLLVSVGALVVFASASQLLAQETHRLQFELYRNDSLVARPTISVDDKGNGSISMRDWVDISFVVTRRTASRVDVTFEIRGNTQTIRPVIGLADEQQGTLSWRSDPNADLLRIRVSRLPR